MRQLALAVVLLCACGDNIRAADPRLVVTKGATLRTTESGGTATFTVGFDQPTTMMVTLTSTKLTEGTVSPSTISLDPTDTDGVLVTVIGVDDTLVDGEQPYQIQVDAGPQGEDRVELVNEDDESSAGGVSVTPTNGTTTEAGGTAQFAVVLTTAPTADVMIPISSSDTAEGTVAITQLVFTTASWDMAQTVTLTGVNDDVDDGDQAYNALLGAATSTDVRYSGMNAADVALTNTDDDAANITVSAPSGVTRESGTQATFTVVLASEPAGDVTIAVASDDATEGTALPASITFTPGTWDTPVTVTASGVDDVLDDGDITYHVVLGAVTSTDPGYSGIDPADVTLINEDNDGVGVTVASTNPILVTNEGGVVDAFTIVLSSQPSAAVTVPIVSADPTEGVTSVGSVTFTTLDWNVPRTIDVTGQDDTIVDGPINYTILIGPTTSTDAAYHNLDPADVAARNDDNDVALVSVFPTDGLFVSEFADSDSFDIVLTSQPTAPVTISLTSGDASEGTLFPTNVTGVTFTPLDWNVPQTVTVRGVDDALADGNIVFAIVTGAAVSLDAAFTGVNPPDVTVTNFDNETANVFVQARKTISTNETGGPSGQATFRVRLTTVPTAAVTCTLASSDTTEGQVVPQTLVLSNTSFQTVTLGGVDDALDDGDVRYTIVTAPCTSTDPDYDQRNPRDVSVLNIDND